MDQTFIAICMIVGLVIMGVLALVRVAFTFDCQPVIVPAKSMRLFVAAPFIPLIAGLNYLLFEMIELMSDDYQYAQVTIASIAILGQAAFYWQNWKSFADFALLNVEINTLRQALALTSTELGLEWQFTKPSSLIEKFRYRKTDTEFFVIEPNLRLLTTSRPERNACFLRIIQQSEATQASFLINRTLEKVKETELEKRPFQVYFDVVYGTIVFLLALFVMNIML